MSHITSIRRAAAISGVTGILALSSAGVASAREIPGNGAPEEFRCTVSCFEGGTTGGLTPPTIGEDGVEILQLGAGVLAGLALAGAGLALASRRSHHSAAHPA